MRKGLTATTNKREGERKEKVVGGGKGILEEREKRKGENRREREGKKEGLDVF